jgi:translation initiation factor IF-3
LLGDLPLRRAINWAEGDGLDLVQVSDDRQPTCRMMDYGKFIFQQSKKKEKKHHQMQEVKFKTRIGENDLKTKVRTIERLLSKGSKVKVSVVFRGREIQNPQIGMTILKTVTEFLNSSVLVERTPKLENRNLYMVLVSK